jgi:hypothetical protein
VPSPLIPSLLGEAVKSIRVNQPGQAVQGARIVGDEAGSTWRLQRGVGSYPDAVAASLNAGNQVGRERSPRPDQARGGDKRKNPASLPGLEVIKRV